MSVHLPQNVGCVSGTQADVQRQKTQDFGTFQKAREGQRAAGRERGRKGKRDGTQVAGSGHGMPFTGVEISASEELCAET